MVAPLMTTLRRWSAVIPSEQDGQLKEQYDECSALSPTACLLRQATLPLSEPADADTDMEVDLYQAALLILAHLDRLAVPFLRPQVATSVGVAQMKMFKTKNRMLIELHFFDTFQHGSESGQVDTSALWRFDLIGTPIERCSLIQKVPFAIEQVSCTPSGLCLLSKEGQAYTICYTDAEPVKVSLQ